MNAIADERVRLTRTVACHRCDGVGWRAVIVDGVRRVKRCECRRPATTSASIDHKTRAAGDR